ncbi:MAG: hypothetical protein KDD99_18025, partial [Bacteroidetes bacterium]|nr:hypothetical protein [Bacteroidota bacterium]
MERIKKYIPSFILVLGGLAVLYAGFGKALTRPNVYVLGKGFDAWKNYFTPAWYIKYDSGFWFTGMNYPFGEHVLFTDNQPLISWVLGFVNQHIVDISAYTVGILNTLIFLSLIGCMYF